MNIEDVFCYTNNIKEQIDANLNMKTEFMILIKTDNSMDLSSFVFFDRKRLGFRQVFSLTFLKTLNNYLFKKIIENFVYLASQHFYEKMYNKCIINGEKNKEKKQ